MMAVLRKSEIRKLKDKDIEKKINELRTEILTLKAKIAAGGAIEEAGKVKPLKKAIARLFTIQRQQQIMAEGKSKKTRRRRTSRGLLIQ